jgi:uncharacterized protein YmfQ (DUF2313 family)
MNHFNSMKTLIPVELGEQFDQHLMIKGSMLDAADRAIDSMIDELFISTASEKTIQRWEKEFGIALSNQSLETRRALVIAKYRQRISLKKGGLRRGIFISIADALGYTINIVESGKPFRAGISAAGDRVYSGSILWTATIVVQNKSSAPDLEALFIEIFPPYLQLVFQYSL